MDEEPEPTVKTFSEALHALDDVKLFLEYSQRCCGVCPSEVVEASYPL